MSEYDGLQFVGIDLHRRRSVIVRTTDAGEALEVARISNDPGSLQAVLARAGEAPQVVLEATYAWYWAADALAAAGAQVHLAHPRRQPVVATDSTAEAVAWVSTWECSCSARSLIPVSIPVSM